MSQDWTAYFAATPWAPVAGAFVLGVATGWLIRGVRPANAQLDPAERVRAKAAQHGTDADETPEPPADGETSDTARIARIEREIADAKNLLAAAAQDGARFEDDLSAVEQAVARANGRLKLMARTVRRIAGIAEDR